MYCILDFETRSEVEITEYGLHNYVIDKSTRALMLGYRIVNTLFDFDTKTELWECDLTPMPDELSRIIEDKSTWIIAHNSAFERYIFKFVLGISIPTSRFQDTQSSARYLSLPSSLEDVGVALGLPAKFRKDKRGKELMKLFSFPQKRKKKDGGETYFNDRTTHPKEWEEYKEYCRQDCVAEQEVARREMLLGAFPLPDRERKIWLFDQKVNDRGIPVDRDFVEKALKMASRNKQEKKDEQNRTTGLENANSQAQLLPWAKDRGYPLNNLRKQNIELILKEPKDDITEECREVLTARMEASSISYKKLDTILRNVSPDNRLRGQFIYCGSSRCGRWSGQSVQLHNFARPDGTFEDIDNVIKARNLIYADDYDGLKTSFVMEQKK